MGLDFGRPQAWRDMDVIGLYNQLYLALVQVIDGLERMVLRMVEEVLATLDLHKNDRA
ncbi:hypothetical protein TIFTF001_027803 [Ficus carica]|uniref:Uncharacterized protein n=1 Tax=Ficus carica TaxID=3494 RepID=A0AA88DNU1_FICCA|nr:hypothetical protein TIFTF001_027803 [Ficus carica]